jgi:hypothetical protein
MKIIKDTATMISTPFWTRLAIQYRGLTANIRHLLNMTKNIARPTKSIFTRIYAKTGSATLKAIYRACEKPFVGLILAGSRNIFT